MCELASGDSGAVRKSGGTVSEAFNSSPPPPLFTPPASEPVFTAAPPPAGAPLPRRRHIAWKWETGTSVGRPQNKQKIATKVRVHVRDEQAGLCLWGGSLGAERKAPTV